MSADLHLRPARKAGEFYLHEGETRLGIAASQEAGEAALERRRRRQGITITLSAGTVKRITEALEGDSNDAEHDALYEIAEQAGLA